MAKRMILVVDDMSSVRHILMVLLKGEGHDAVGASNGRVALDLLARRKYDLVLCDWNMPGMDGTQLVVKIREKYPVLPIIMVTAENSPERVKELAALGITGYLIKPFKPDALLSLVRRLFPSRRPSTLPPS